MAGAGVGAVQRAGHTQIDMRDSEKCVGKSELEAGQKIRVPETNGCDAMCFWIAAGILLQFLFLRRSFSFRVVSQEIKQPLSIDQISVRVGEWRGIFRFEIWLYWGRNEIGTEERNRMDGLRRQMPLATIWAFYS
ncbi:hypothetical protein FOXB_04104 [Fusarium oxysporum f. sp. conglutinans Fo5176]|uniref:Uncharacterized protein n=1 Tax=Fusarium oxysporum (strain Fo5176) TaxID=660025 RepID=F9FCH6_FUSOF|nr:hypothetical protein FOXB_04104 [Fusarium oxysporum f. sp. conglutinans Fo5176]